MTMLISVGGPFSDSPFIYVQSKRREDVFFFGFSIESDEKYALGSVFFDPILQNEDGYTFFLR